MANEASWSHGYILSEQPMQAVGRILSSHPWYALPESCRSIDRSVMRALHSSYTGLDFPSSKRPYSPWSSDSELASSKWPKLKENSWNSTWSTSSRPLATFPCSFSPAETPFPNSPSCTELVVRKPNSYVSEGSLELEELRCFDTNVSSTQNTGVATMPMSPELTNDSESWQVRVVASSCCKSPSLLASDVIGTVDFNSDGELFATGGIARKIRICSYVKMSSAETRRSSDEDEEFSSDEDDGEGRSSTRPTSMSRRRRPTSSSGLTLDHGEVAVGEICTPGKLSSLKWRPEGSEVIGCGDYDGVVSEWNIEHKQTVSEWYEHSGQRVWSLDYSKLTPTLSASASGDGTMRVWRRGSEKSVTVIKPPSRNSVCCAEFSPASQYLIALASADSNVYLYDLRRPESSLLKLTGHGSAVSYVRFLGMDKLVSASIDSTLKLWDLSSQFAGTAEVTQENSGSTPDAHLERTFREHTNVKKFVGLSVHRGAGILACGSETNEVFAYRTSSSTPLLRHKLPAITGCPVRDREAGGGNPFVGAVCWREQGNDYSIVAANSEGVVQLLKADLVGRA